MSKGEVLLLKTVKIPVIKIIQFNSIPSLSFCPQSLLLSLAPLMGAALLTVLTSGDETNLGTSLTFQQLLLCDPASALSLNP